MSADLEGLFNTMRRDTMSPALAEPAAVRRAAEHRTRVRRGLTVLAGAAAAAVATAVVLAVGTAPAVPPPVTTTPSPTVPTPGPSLSTEPSPTDSRSPSGGADTPTERPDGTDCRPSDFDPRTIYAADHVPQSTVTVVVVRNASPTACRLRTYPTVLYTDPSGTVRTMPARRLDPSQPTVLLAPGQYAQFEIRSLNGNIYGPGATAGPDSTACPRSGEFHGLSVVLAEGRRYPLLQVTILDACGQPLVGHWVLSIYPTPIGMTMTQLPSGG
jgi:hypothetical protein